MQQPKWNQYEVALLIEAYWKIEEKKLPRKTVVTLLSDTLRLHAIDQGVVIDEIYRNENGINMRLEELKYLFSSDHNGLKNTSNLFKQMVQLYSNSNKSYKKILVEAKGMVNIQSITRQKFSNWLSVNAPSVKPDVLCYYLPFAERFCMRIKVLSAPLFETTDEPTIKRFARTVNENQVFRIYNRKHIKNIISAASWYYAFVKDLPNFAAVDKIIEVIPTTSTTNEEACSINTVDLENIPSLTYTKPIAFTYHGIREEQIANWTELYSKLFKSIYNANLDVDEINQTLRKSGILDFGSTNDMTAPKCIVDNYNLVTNIGATDIVKKVAALLDILGISSDDVVIEYRNMISSDEAYRSEKSNKDISIMSDRKSRITFSEWFINIEKMATSTCNSYVSALNTAESYAREHNLANRSISGTNCKEALLTINCLMADEGFRQFNIDQQNRFSIAFDKLKKYFRYLYRNGMDSSYYFSINNPEKSKTQPGTKTTSTEINNEMSAYLKANHDGISEENVFAHFRNYNLQQVNLALTVCHAVKVLGKFYNKDNIYDYEKMAEILLNVLMKQFITNGNYTSAKQLYDDVHIRLDDFFFYNNAFESRREVFDLAVHLFTQENYKGNSFIFLNGIHIWKNEPNYPKDFRGLLIKYGREHQNVFTREQALTFFESIGSASPDQLFSSILYNSGSKSFLQYAENCFVLIEALPVNDNFLSNLKVQIGNLLEDEAYITFNEITDFFYTTLPDIPTNIKWSPFLLKDILRLFDIGYITVEAGNDNNRRLIPAAILKKDTPIKTFSDLVWNEMLKSFSLPKELTASEFRKFLLDKGLIHGTEMMCNVHKTVANDLRFYWTERNNKVTIN